MPGTSNNAPPPPPGNTNPTGTNKGVGFGGVSYPNYPVFGAPQTGSPVSPSANAPIFGSSGIQNLSSGFGSIPGGSQYTMDLYNQLGKAYGKGTGQLLGNIITQGLFNPQEAAAFLNAMQPSINQGLASTQNSFGAEGSRFGSAAALGIGNYESQVNLNEQQTLASMYMQSQQEQLQLLESVLPTIHGEKANSGGWVHDLIGGLEIAGSVIADVATAGAAIPFTTPILGAGVQQLGQGITGGGGSSSSSAAPPIPSFGLPGTAGNTGTFGANSPTTGWNNPASPYYLDPTLLDASAGSDLGGSNIDMSQFNGLF